MAFTVAALLDSCAYMQTHKNVEEVGSYYEGHLLKQGEMPLYKVGEAWYLGAYPARFKLRYPLIHDSVFQRQESKPYFRLKSRGSNMEYHLISSHMAEVLQRPDGYFQMQSLAECIKKEPGGWMNALPTGAHRHAVHAELSGYSSQWIEEYRVPSKKTPTGLVLGKLDFLAIDVPGTLAYNVAIPVIAPFVFFYDFLTND